MKRHCPDPECATQKHDPNSRAFIRKGRFYRSSDGQWIARYQCTRCKLHFSSATLVSCYRQKKRKLNHPIALLLCSGVSQRRAAMLLGVNPKTIVRKFRFLANEARKEQDRFLRDYETSPLKYVQFDDLETSEHTKCKPLSVALAVEPESRKIIGFEVSPMPAKGLLAKVALRKYGLRKDRRGEGWSALFCSLKSIVDPKARFLSDENPHYPVHLKRHFPYAIHDRVKGRRGCVVGQGELKKIGFDPLFSLNHSCAMLRANMNRLFRRTWCTTKTKQGLMDHLSLYVHFHNHVLTASGTG